MSSCPKRDMDPAAYQFIDFARMARRGAWPEAGGLLDQLQVVVDAFRFLWDIEDAQEARRKLNHG